MASKQSTVSALSGLVPENVMPQPAPAAAASVVSSEPTPAVIKAPETVVTPTAPQKPMSAIEAFAKSANIDLGPVEDKPGATPATAATPAVTEPSSEEVVIDSPIFGGKRVINQKPVAVGEVPEPIKAMLKDKYGAEDADAFFSDVLPKWHESQAKLQEVDDKFTALSNLIQSAPDILYAALNDFADGKDWQKTLQSAPRLDLSKSVDSVPKRELVDAYLKGEFTEEDWDAYADKEGDPVTKKAINLGIRQAEEKFKADQDKFRDARTQAATRKTQEQQAFKASIAPAIQNLRRSIPDVDPAFARTVERELTEGGPDAIRKVFFGPDNALTAEGAVRYVFAMHGKELLQQYSKLAFDNGQREERTQILERTSERPMARSSARGASTVSPGVRKRVESILELATKPKY